ncbi:LptF/LptG family permease [Rufibacter latericius]|uniref:YjgP/YjgQ family permease n=1 Tax=Rufibacter latericius TaxID=2487040 RepID=A0A3M9MYV5_9BACT|nr:LptF/LptG family permease [Rufibacter latericius]RNI30731.1 YjgP/YjgQ family permease [Rufibacter latericius]
MKKLDKLILKSFIGPFVLTFAVVEFILLLQVILKYLDDLIGKDLGVAVISELLFYFSLNLAPMAFPLAILLSSLMTFGNLGEHHELTAIKTSGISLVRALRPVFLFAVLLTIAAFFFHNTIVPKANLKAYSLMWDIRQKKPSLDLKEGSFYNGLPNRSIRVGKKFEDGQTLKDIMIYDHSNGQGNAVVMLADSGKMYTQFNDQYLVLEMFDGKTFAEERPSSSNGFGQTTGYLRQAFSKNKIVVNLASFQMTRSNAQWFADNKMMKNINQLTQVTDSLQKQITKETTLLEPNVRPFFSHFSSLKTRDTLNIKVKAKATKPEILLQDVQAASNAARNVKSFTSSYASRLTTIQRERNNYEIEIYRKFTQAFACFIMFLIGAPLGAIIRKGGLGMPVIISIAFFIVYYVLSILGEKWGREGVAPVVMGMWAANLILLPVGLFFLFQARNDSSLLEFDFWRKLTARFKRAKVH